MSHYRRLLIAALILIAALALAVPAVAQTTPTSAVVNTGLVNVRENSSVGFRVIGTAGLGTTVEMLGRNPDSSWAQVRLPNGLVGWVGTAHLNAVMKFSDLPQTSTIVEPLGVVNALALNVRIGPGIQHAVSFTLYQHTPVSLIGKSLDGNWLLIRESSRVGWVNASLITMSVSMAELPRLDSASVIVTAPVGVVGTSTTVLPPGAGFNVGGIVSGTATTLTPGTCCWLILPNGQIVTSLP